jgi:hypothetical protein
MLIRQSDNKPIQQVIAELDKEIISLKNQIRILKSLSKQSENQDSDTNFKEEVIHFLTELDCNDPKIALFIQTLNA